MVHDADRARLEGRLLAVNLPVSRAACQDRTILGDAVTVLGHLPEGAFHLVIADPPYNLTKDYAGTTFNRMSDDRYADWLRSWFGQLRARLTPTGSAYICGDWRSLGAIERVARDYLTVRNRITWEREKGRGAARNWKNCSEDIWFCTVGDAYYFDVAAMKQKRRVLAPYRDADGRSKDRLESDGGRFRDTHPSNLWTDLTVPFWSMPENTDHPTQKPEKLIAKLILASCPFGGAVLDPFLGSGTTSMVAAKLGRHYTVVEIERDYCQLAERRLELAREDPTIQGYRDGVFWERNSAPPRPSVRSGDPAPTLLARPG